MWYIWYSTSTLIFFLSLIFGFLLLLLFVFICVDENKKVPKKNQVVSIENQLEYAQTKVESVNESIVRIETNNNNNNKLKKQIIDKKMDLSNINSKYLNNPKHNVRYSNYLTKSNRSFLGY